MKKIIIFCLLAMLMCIVATAQTQTFDGVYWDFCDEDDYREWLPSGGFASVEAGVYLLNFTTGDTQLINFLVDESFSADEYKYFAFRYRTNNVTGYAQSAMFFTNEEHPDITDQAVLKFNITKDGNLNNRVVECAQFDKPEGPWGGNITSLRFDPINDSRAKEGIYISRIGFFKTQEAAEEFLEAAGDEQRFDILTIFRDDMQCSYVPANTMQSGFDKADYMVADTEESGNVVMYTDASGDGRVVALSHVNNAGFVTFSPNRAADYYIAQNDVSYSDTASHWGREDIEYASEHALFNGTNGDEFSPDMPMTRGMFVTVMGRLCGVDDTGEGEYYTPYLEWAIENGYCDTTLEDFRAEEGITRLEMASFIDNFISKSDYSLWKEKTEEFSDLSALSQEQKTAVNNVRAYGIINGMDGDNFDPSGLLTRAEAAAVMTRLIKNILGIDISPYSPEYFRRDRLKLGVKGSFEPYDILDQDYMQRVADCGFDWIIGINSSSFGEPCKALLNFADRNGIEIYLSDDAYKDDVNVAEYADHPSYTGTYIYDEPGLDEMPDIADMANKYLQETGRDPHVNLLPLYSRDNQLQYGANTTKEYTRAPDITHEEFYSQYVEEWAKQADADFMSVDIYPLNSDPEKPTYTDYIESINLFARAARENDKEFYAYIQSYGWEDGKRNANLRDFRWQAYSMLSFGCKGLIYWSYTSQRDNTRYSLVDWDGQPTEIYYAAQTSLGELKKLSDVYCSYDNIGAFNYKYSSTTTPYLCMTNPVTPEAFPAITASNIESDGPLLIGCFNAKEGTGKAFTLVNMNEPTNDKDANVSFSVNGYTKVTAYIKGEPVILTPWSGMYSVTLEEGEGIFITLDN